MNTSIRPHGKSKKRPATRTPTGARKRKSLLPEVEMYTDERIAEFILNNAIDAEDYRRAYSEVRKLGIDPETIAHHKPMGVA